MPANGTAAVVSGKKTLSDSEVLAYSKNRFADRNLHHKVRQLKDQMHVSHDRHLREIFRWKGFMRQSVRTSGVWSTSFDSCDSDDCSSPGKDSSASPTGSGEPHRETGARSGSPHLSSPRRANNASLELARSLNFQSEALSRLQTPWAYTFSSASHNSRYNQAEELARGQEKRLFLRRALFASNSSSNHSSSESFDKEGRDSATSGFGKRPLTGRSTPGLPLKCRGDKLSVSTCVHKNRPKTSSGVVHEPNLRLKLKKSAWVDNCDNFSTSAIGDSGEGAKDGGSDGSKNNSVNNACGVPLSDSKLTCVANKTHQVKPDEVQPPCDSFSKNKQECAVISSTTTNNSVPDKQRLASSYEKRDKDTAVVGSSACDLTIPYDRDANSKESQSLPLPTTPNHNDPDVPAVVEQSNNDKDFKDVDNRQECCPSPRLTNRVSEKRVHIRLDQNESSKIERTVLSKFDPVSGRQSSSSYLTQILTESATEDSKSIKKKKTSHISLEISTKSAPENRGQSKTMQQAATVIDDTGISMPSSDGLNGAQTAATPPVSATPRATAATAPSSSLQSSPSNQPEISATDGEGEAAVKRPNSVNPAVNGPCGGLVLGGGGTPVPDFQPKRAEEGRSQKDHGSLTRRYSAIDLRRRGSFMKIVEQLDVLRERDTSRGGRMIQIDGDKELDSGSQNETSRSANGANANLPNGNEVSSAATRSTEFAGKSPISIKGSQYDCYKSLNQKTITKLALSESSNTLQTIYESPSPEKNKPSLTKTSGNSAAPDKTTAVVEAVEAGSEARYSPHNANGGFEFIYGQTHDFLNFDDDASSAGDSNYTSFHGFKIRNYVRPQERYRSAPVLGQRRQGSLFRLSIENPVCLNGNRGEILRSEMIFSRSTRQKVLQELVDRNNKPTKSQDRGIVPPQLRAKIEDFYKTIEPYCQKPEFVLDQKSA